jgi:hypothetical protein
MYHRALLGKQCLELVGMAGVGGCMMAIRYLVKKHLAIRYDQMQRGVLSIYNYGTFIRKYGPADFRMERALWIAGAVFAGFCALVLSAALLTKKDTFYQIFKRVLSQDRAKYTIVQKLVLLPSSCHNASTIANDQDQGKYVDPISQNTFDRIDVSNILLVGSYALNIKDVLKMVFTKELDDKGMIHHPIESRSLTLEEQAKFLNEVCAFLCIDQQAFLDCWKLELTTASVSDHLKPYIPHIRILGRIVKFFTLLPDRILGQEFREILMNEQRAIFKHLVSAQLMSLTTIEILGVMILPFVNGFLNLESIEGGS